MASHNNLTHKFFLELLASAFDVVSNLCICRTVLKYSTLIQEYMYLWIPLLSIILLTNCHVQFMWQVHNWLHKVVKWSHSSPDFGMCIKHGSHESCTRARHSTNEDQWHVPIIRIHLPVLSQDVCLKHVVHWESVAEARTFKFSI